jgi:hypothetical protein
LLPTAGGTTPPSAIAATDRSSQDQIIDDNERNLRVNSDARGLRSRPGLPDSAVGPNWVAVPGVDNVVTSADMGGI